MSDLALGTYRHYKGGLYEVLEIGRYHDTEDHMVVYRNLQRSFLDDRAIWVRPLKEFTEMVEHKGTQVPRFRFLGAKPKHRMLGKLLAVSYFDLLMIFTLLIMLLGIFIVTRDFRDPGFFFAVHPILGWFVTTMLGAAIFAIGYARFIGPWKLAITRKTILIPGLTAPIKLALFSDLQVGDHKRAEWMEKIVEKMQKIKPDLILIAGDLVSNELNPEDESVYLEPLSELPKLCPTLAVLGNHDYGIGLLSGGVSIKTQDKSQEVTNRMISLGIPILVNTIKEVTIGQQTISVFGADDLWGGKQDYTALNNVQYKDPMILLAHNPDAILDWPNNLPSPALTLAGHTHGGQLRLPIIGPIGDAYIKLTRKYYQGLNTYKGAQIFVTTGVGESMGPLRIGVSPEIAVLTLQPK